MLARAVSLNVAGQAGGFAVSFLSSIMLARLLGPADRGLLAMIISVSVIPLGIAGLGLASSTQYFGSRRGVSQRALLGNSLLYGVALAAVVLPVGWLLHGRLADWFGHGHGGMLWALGAVLIPLGFLDNTTAGQLCGRLQFGLWNLLLIGARLATLACVVVLVWVFALGVGGALVATAASSVTIILVSTVAILGRRRPAFDLGLFKREVSYGRKAQVGLLFHSLNYRLDLIVLGVFASPATVGYYAVAQTLAELAIYLGTAFQISVMPLVSRSDAPDQRNRTSRAAVQHHGLLAILVLAVNAAVGPLILTLGYGHAFAPALLPFFILLPAMWFLSTGNMITGDLRGRGLPGLSSTLKGGAAVATVVLDLALIPRFGVVGAACASAAAYTIFGLISLRTLAKLADCSIAELVVPGRDDLRAYRTAAGRAAARLRNTLSARRAGDDPPGAAPALTRGGANLW